MYLGKKILTVITAREGSKRLPNKNILDLAGKPLIAWSIDEAKKSKYIDKLIVSTNSPKIADIAKIYGCEVPFIRPENLSNDTADSVSVLKHAIQFFEGKFDYIMLLQPTSPLRNVEDIDKAIGILNHETRSVVSVCETDHSPLWSNTLPKDLSMKSFIREELKNKRSQDLPIYYRLNGAIYVSDVDYFYKMNGFFGVHTKALVMSKERSIDIDTYQDFVIAKVLMCNQ